MGTGNNTQSLSAAARAAGGSPAEAQAPGPAASRSDRIRATLQNVLAPSEMQLDDESHLHAGHAGAREGKGHFRVRIVSERFAGLRSIARHRLVYQSLADLMLTDIHALNITALTPDEVHSGTAGFSQQS